MRCLFWFLLPTCLAQWGDYHRVGAGGAGRAWIRQNYVANSRAHVSAPGTGYVQVGYSQPGDSPTGHAIPGSYEQWVRQPVRGPTVQDSSHYRVPAAAGTISTYPSWHQATSHHQPSQSYHRVPAERGSATLGATHQENNAGSHGDYHRVPLTESGAGTLASHDILDYTTAQRPALHPSTAPSEMQPVIQSPATVPNAEGTEYVMVDFASQDVTGRAPQGNSEQAQGGNSPTPPRQRRESGRRRRPGPPQNPPADQEGIIAGSSCPVGVIGQDGCAANDEQAAMEPQAGEVSNDSENSEESEDSESLRNEYQFIGRQFVIVNDGPDGAEEIVRQSQRTGASEGPDVAPAADAPPVREVDNEVVNGIEHVNGDQSDTPRPNVGLRNDEVMFKYPLCPVRCLASMLGDGVCDEECDVNECGYDDGDCAVRGENVVEAYESGDSSTDDAETCADACDPVWLGDGECDIDCFTAGCRFDEGDCAHIVG